MLKKILGLFFIFISLNAFATQNTISDELPLKINFSYVQRDQKGNDNEQVIENNITVNPNNHQWFTLNNLPNDQKAPPVILLGKIDKATGEQITMHFLVLDLIDSKPIIISEPKLITNYGQTGALNISINKDNHLKLTLVAG